MQRVLLVDDNPLFLEVVQDFLRELGEVQVVGTCSSGKEALDALERLAPHVIVLDISMPGMNGFELTRAIKARSSSPSVIVLTLLDTPRHKRAALEAGADAFVGKARMDIDLLPTIRSVTARS